MKFYEYIILSLIIFLYLYRPVWGQDISKDKENINRIVLRNCEQNNFALNFLNSAAPKDGLIIAIARLGDGETQNKFNWRRLHNIKVYLTKFGLNRNPETLILAQGERVKGYGRIEVYLEGKLVDILATKQNQDLLVGSCEPDDIRPVEAEKNFYPYLDQKNKTPVKRNRRKSTTNRRDGWR